jgi:hypothetical protein
MHLIPSLAIICTGRIRMNRIMWTCALRVKQSTILRDTSFKPSTDFSRSKDVYLHLVGWGVLDHATLTFTLRATPRVQQMETCWKQPSL